MTSGMTTFQSITPSTIIPSLISPNTVTSSNYYATWSVAPSDPNLLSGFANATINGSVRVLWQYTYDLIPGAAVPAPLPLLGAGAAFGWTRRLRKRISAKV
jgi:hypothetical protein